MIPRLLCIPLALGSHALAQCTPQWRGYSGPGPDANILTMSVWDPDGAGPLPSGLVVAGNFQHIGSSAVPFVAFWDGQAFRPMGEGVLGTVLSSTVFQSAGAAIAEPIIGGYFRTSGAAVLNCVGAFREGRWVPLGSGLEDPTLPWAQSMAQLGDRLFVAGHFSAAGGLSVLGVAQWDGSNWYALADERVAPAHTMATLDGTLYAGGLFAVPVPSPLNSVIKWVDPQWVAVGDDPDNRPNNEVWSLALFRGRLVACGPFASPAGQVALFDGTAWSSLGTGINGSVNALCVFDPDGPGPLAELLIAGGAFTIAGGQPAASIAAWDGAHWFPLGSGTSGTIRTMTVWNNQLAVAGDFFSIGGVISPRLAFWGCPQPCYPNCDASTTPPALNVNDFTCFLNAFAAASPYANCDNSTLSPTLNVIDFLCFLNGFAAGCP